MAGPILRELRLWGVLRLTAPPTTGLPFGWAALWCLYGLR
jgi:hypothetical protein